MVNSKLIFDNINNKNFQIEFEDNLPIKCELIEVKGINSSTLKKGQSEPFSLVFQSKEQRVFEQNTYKLTHSELNDLALFLVPIGSDDIGVRYEAVFT